VVVTNVGTDKTYRNFYVTATNPAGPWSDPVFMTKMELTHRSFLTMTGRSISYQTGLANRLTKGQYTKVKLTFQQEKEKLRSGKFGKVVGAVMLKGLICIGKMVITIC